MKLLIILLSVSIELISGGGVPSTSLSCSLNEFNSLYEKVSADKDVLANLVRDVESRGHDCGYEYITLNVTELFMTFTLYDINNTEVLCRAYSQQYGKEGCDQGKALPCRELNKTIDILYKATNDLKKLTQDVSLYRRPVPSHAFRSVKQVGGYFYHSTDSQPLFSGGYDHGDYAFYYGFESNIAEQLVQIGQDSDEVDVHIATLIPTEETVNKSEIDRVVSTFDRLYSLGLTSGLVLGCNLPEWVIDKYPEIRNYGSSSCKLNTDHPAVLLLWEKGLTPLIQALESHPALNSYRLGNEVFFNVMNNKTVISNYTTSKWHQWLIEEYTNISALNQIWKTEYTDFKQVFFPAKLNPKTNVLSPDKSLIGGPHWHDYCQFNAERILEYFTELINIIKKIHPLATTHIKYVNYHLFTYYYCNGVDRLALNNMTDWSGCDTRIVTAPISYIEAQFRNTGQYALDWLPATIAYTWMGTTIRDKPVIDLEVHPITTSKYRNGSIPDNHMSAVTWLIHLHGLALHMTWAWPREANGSYKFDIVDSYPTLPQAVDGYGKTLALLNALGPEVLALAKAPKPVCMLWSRDSSIQDMDYLNTQIYTFEALSFFGPQPQFIAEPLVDSPGNFNDAQCKVLVVPGQQYVSDHIVNTIHSYVNDYKGNVIFTGNSYAFQYTPIGFKRNSSELKWMQNLPHIPDQDPTKLLRALEPHLAPAMEDRLVKCVDRSTNLTLWGVICRGAEIQNTKSIVVSVVNVLTVPVYVTLYTKSKIVTKATSMYMFNEVDLKTPLRMEPLDVQILKIKS